MGRYEHVVRLVGNTQRFVVWNFCFDFPVCVWGEKRISQQQQEEEGEETQRTARKPKQMNKKNQSSRSRKYAKKKTLKLIDYSVQLTNLYTLSLSVQTEQLQELLQKKEEKKEGREEGTLYMPLRRIFRQTQSTHSPRTLASEAIYCSWAVTGSCYALPAGREGGAEV